MTDEPTPAVAYFMPVGAEPLGRDATNALVYSDGDGIDVAEPMHVTVHGLGLTDD